MILVLVTFVVGCIYYITSKEDKAIAFASFFIGTILGIIACIVLSFVKFPSLANTDSLALEALRLFLAYFLIPMVIALPLFLLFSFSLSEETFMQIPSMLMGLFTIMFIAATFSHRTEPEHFRAEILLLMMFTVVFLAELLFNLSNNLSFLSPISAVIIAIIVLMVLCYPICLILGNYHFTNNRVLTFILATVVLGLVLLPQRIIAIFK